VIDFSNELKGIIQTGLVRNDGAATTTGGLHFAWCGISTHHHRPNTGFMGHHLDKKGASGAAKAIGKLEALLDAGRCEGRVGGLTRMMFSGFQGADVVTGFLAPYP
jgi:hypothetical protein